MSLLITVNYNKNIFSVIKFFKYIKKKSDAHDPCLLFNQHSPVLDIHCLSKVSELQEFMIYYSLITKSSWNLLTARSQTGPNESLNESCIKVRHAWVVKSSPRHSAGNILDVKSFPIIHISQL